MTIHPLRPEAEGFASIRRGIQGAGRATAVRVSCAGYAGGYRVAEANFLTKMHVGVAAGHSGGRRGSRLDSPDWKDAQACSRPAPERLRRKADRPQEAPGRQASEWPAFGAAVSVAVLEGKDRAGAAEEPLTPPRGRIATAPRPGNLLGRAPCLPAPTDSLLRTDPR